MMQSLRDISPVRELTKDERQDLMDNYDLFSIIPERIIHDHDKMSKTIIFQHPGTGETVQIKVKVNS